MFNKWILSPNAVHYDPWVKTTVDASVTPTWADSGEDPVPVW